jgi:hypothetical protein
MLLVPRRYPFPVSVMHIKPIIAGPITLQIPELMFSLRVLLITFGALALLTCPLRRPFGQMRCRPDLGWITTAEVDPTPYLRPDVCVETSMYARLI